MKTEIIYQDQFFYSKAGQPFSFRFRRVIMSAFMLLSDSLVISGSILFSVTLWSRVRTDLQVEPHISIIPPVIFCFTFIYHLLTLYPAIGVGPVEELKRLIIGTFFVGLALFALSFFLRNTIIYSRATLLISWGLISAGIPLSRKVFRRIAVKLGVWGVPVMIAGEKNSVMHFRKHLSMHPLSGFWPVLCISGNIKDIFPRENSINIYLFKQIKTLLIAEGRGKFDTIKHLVTQRKYGFEHIIVLFDEKKVGPIWFMPVAILEYMGLEVIHNLLNSTQKKSKRIIEILLITLSIPVLAMLFSIIAILIKISSSGPVFYKHKRVGLDGKDIWIWKFRTMVYNADTLLTEGLKKDPLLQEEWEKTFKLKNDPRITTIGRILRRTSLDELPQIWNVIIGEMSLIGPRPIVEDEIPLYGDDFEIYKQVRPGITGLWQISGRNNLPYRDRVTLDIYYIQNWSIWLDIHILLHTVLATLQARGAY